MKIGLYGTLGKVRCGCSMAATRVAVRVVSFPLGPVGMWSVDNLRVRVAQRRGGVTLEPCGCLCEKAGMSGLLPYSTPSISRVAPTFLNSCPFPCGS